MAIITFLLHILYFNYVQSYNLHGESGQAYAIEIKLGNPPQKLNVLVDTGSTTLAIDSYSRNEGNIYFHFKNSSSLYDTRKEVQAKYSQGMWVGRLVTDLVQIPSLSYIPQVRSNIALITRSQNFFVNGSGWQGLLGLAYLPVGAWGDHIVVESWLDSVDHILLKQMSFSLQLCGAKSRTNATHYGNFVILDEGVTENNKTFYTPILRKRWFEIGIISIHLITNSYVSKDENLATGSNSSVNVTSNQSNEEMCVELNKEKSIVDSGTTNIKLPDAIFRAIVDQLKNITHLSNELILDEFWYRGEAACWPEPQKWDLPWLAVDLLSSSADFQYFTLEIPPQSYMRLVSAQNSSEESGALSNYCYKLGLEAGGTETVLGYTAMEGFEILFNRSAGWISWQTSDCGPDVRITGPHNASSSLVTLCQLKPLIPDMAVSIKAAQWALCVVSIVAASILLYLLAPFLTLLWRRPFGSTRSQQISLSQASLVDLEPS